MKKKSKKTFQSSAGGGNIYYRNSGSRIENTSSRNRSQHTRV